MVCCVIQSDGAVRENLIPLPLANQQTLSHFLVRLASNRLHLYGRGGKSDPAPAGLTFGSVNADQSQTKHFMSMRVSPDINTYVLL